MLEYLRQRSQSAVIIFFVAIISAVFIINFGPQSQGCGSEGAIWLAKVHGTTINISDYRWVERLVRNRYRLPREYVEGGRFARDVLEGLIERELLAHWAANMGLAVGEEQVRASVVERGQIHFSWPAGSFIPLRGPVLTDFRNDEGAFDSENFSRYLAGLQLSPRAFAEQQASDILAERMRQLVEHSTQISEEELWAEYSRYADRVNLDYVRIYPAFFREAIRPSAEELRAWADENSDDIEQRYEADRFRYRNVRKQVRVTDIMIRVSEDADDDETAARQKRAEAIRELASAPDADLGLLARCFSDDTQGAARSGDLGYLRKGMSRFGREFDDAVFELEPQSISDVITTKRGLHIVKVVDQREGDIELDDARMEIAERLYRKARGDSRAEEVVELVLERARGGAEFEESILEGITELAPDECPALPGIEEPEGAEEQPPRRRPLAPVIRESGFFNRSGMGVPGIGESSDLMTAAFELTEEDPVAEEAIRVRDDFFIIRLADEGRQSPSREEFEEERPGFERRLLSRKRREVLRIFVQRIRREAEADGAVERNQEGIRFITRGRGDEEGDDEEESDEGEERSSSSERGSDRGSSSESSEGDDE